MEHSHRVGAAADTRDHRVRLASCQFAHLPHTFATDYRLKVSHHQRVGMRAGDRAAAVGILEKAVKGGRTLVRLGGRDVTVAFPPGGGLDWLAAIVGASKSGSGGRGGDWPMHRGDAARNGVANASCPLLVPRYRVPLARHPEESRLLEARRRLAADQELPMLPAGTLGWWRRPDMSINDIGGHETERAA